MQVTWSGPLLMGFSQWKEQEDKTVPVRLPDRAHPCPPRALSPRFGLDAAGPAPVPSPGPVSARRSALLPPV